MAQYDLHLVQNVHPSGVEFTEVKLNLAKGAILSADASQNLSVLAAGTNGHHLVRDDAETTGLKWVANTTGHTQNTDTGTTALKFIINSGAYALEETAESASKWGIKVSGGATYADLQAKDGTFNKVTVGSTSPSGAYELTHKTYVDGLFAANDAMLFKGTIGTAGTHAIAAFNALTTYNSGWTYRVIEAGTIRGVVCQIGDIVMVLTDRTGSGNTDGDFTVVQTNIDGAVTGPASVTDGALVLFDTTSGKLIKAGTSAPGTMAYETATNYVTKALYDANTILIATTDNTPIALTIGASTFVGRKATGDISAMSISDAMALLWVSAPAAKNSTGVAGTWAKDANYKYECTATDTWKRAMLATNWV